MKFFALYVLIFLLLLMIGSCATTSPYKDQSPSSLSDEQLIEEYNAVAEAYGEAVKHTAHLKEIRPEPSYYLASSSTHISGFISSPSVIQVPPRYGRNVIYSGGGGTFSGNAMTTHHYANRHGLKTAIIDVQTLISEVKESKYKERELEVLEEVQKRINHRKAELEVIVNKFFEENPEMESKRELMIVVSPWVPADGVERDAYATLVETKNIINNMKRGRGLTGDWYGILSQKTTLTDGEEVSLSEFIKMELRQYGMVLNGEGMLGPGEEIKVKGIMKDGNFSGTVANVTGKINLKFSGIAYDDQLTISFKGTGLGQTLEGTTVLIR